MSDDYKEIVQAEVLNEETFVKLTMKGIVRGEPVPWRRIAVRPVLIKDERHLQFSYFDEKRDITKNYRGRAAEEKLAEVLAIPFSSIRVETVTEDWQIQLTKKGKALIHRNKAPHGASERSLEHNRTKDLPLPADQADAFWRQMGMLNNDGKIKPQMQGKFSQINEFLKLLNATGELEKFEKSPIDILDCGCGSSYLTLATYHYLNHVRGIPAMLTGIDVREDLIDKSTQQSGELQFAHCCFRRSAIIDFQPDTRPDIVLALHACDTATDEVIAQSIRWQTQMLLSIPCCHHDLNEQLAAPEQSTAGVFRPVLRHGILKERMADILTDSFRALVLRIMGYRTDVIEFISTEHTARNLMIRAVQATEAGDRRFIQEYNELKRFWNVTPYLEKLLGEPFTGLLR